MNPVQEPEYDVSETFEVAQIDHVELFVPDQYEAAAWFERVLGLRVVVGLERWADGGPLMIASREGRTMLALFAGEPVQAPPEVNFRRVAFRVDAAGMLAFLARLGELDLRTETGRPVLAGDELDHDGSFSIYFVDPWGHRFEVTTYEVEQFAALRDAAE